ncbi:MAG: hypothetical protein R3F59_10735 [Myxococcota bacterium]
MWSALAVCGLLGPLASWATGNYLGIVVACGLGLFLAAMMSADQRSRPGPPPLPARAPGPRAGRLRQLGAGDARRPWVHVAGHTRVALALRDGQVAALDFAEAGALRAPDPDGRWVAVDFPGAHARTLALAPDGTAVALEDRREIGWAFGRAWTQEPGLRQVRGLVGTDRAVLAAADGQLHRRTPRGWVAVPGVAADAVCARGADVLAVGGGRTWRSADGGDTFAAGEAAGPAHDCALAADGSAWLVDRGLFHSALARLGPHPRTVEAPSPRVEAVAVDPDDADHVWLGVWGEGVFRTVDGGAVWTREGLRGWEVAALVVDFGARRAWAGTGSGVLERRF